MARQGSSSGRNIRRSQNGIDVPGHSIGAALEALVDAIVLGSERKSVEEELSKLVNRPG